MAYTVINDKKTINWLEGKGMLEWVKDENGDPIVEEAFRAYFHLSDLDTIRAEYKKRRIKAKDEGKEFTEPDGFMVYITTIKVEGLMEEKKCALLIMTKGRKNGGFDESFDSEGDFIALSCPTVNDTEGNQELITFLEKQKPNS